MALITSYMARNETRSIPPKASGDGMATAGIIMGWVQVGLIASTLLTIQLTLIIALSAYAQELSLPDVIHSRHGNAY